MSGTNPLSILVIDDEVELLAEIARNLRRRGHHVTTAACYDTGLALIDGAVDPDVLITDVRMPGGSGLDLAKHAKRRHSRCRIIVMTGHLDDSQISTVTEADAATVLFKPFSIRKLAALIAPGGAGEAPPRVQHDPVTVAA